MIKIPKRIKNPPKNGTVKFTVSDKIYFYNEYKDGKIIYKIRKKCYRKKNNNIGLTVITFN